MPAGARGCLLRVATAAMTGHERFIKAKLFRVEKVASIESSFALRQVKFASSLPLASTAPPA